MLTNSTELKQLLSRMSSEPVQLFLHLHLPVRGLVSVSSNDRLLNGIESKTILQPSIEYL